MITFHRNNCRKSKLPTNRETLLKEWKFHSFAEHNITWLHTPGSRWTVGKGLSHRLSFADFRLPGWVAVAIFQHSGFPLPEAVTKELLGVAEGWQLLHESFKPAHWICQSLSIRKDSAVVKCNPSTESSQTLISTSGPSTAFCETLGLQRYMSRRERNSWFLFFLMFFKGQTDVLPFLAGWRANRKAQVSNYSESNICAANNLPSALLCSSCKNKEGINALAVASRLYAPSKVM